MGSNQERGQVKYVANAFLATRISFINDDPTATGADVHAVAKESG
jgi:UDP-glucose 6-dehydrogenase